MLSKPLNNEHPSLYFGHVDLRREFPNEKHPFLLLIEEVIDYSLRHHNLTWEPPVNLEYARKMNKFTYFNENFAATVVSRDTEEKAVKSAKGHGFDEIKWLLITDPSKAITCLEKYLVKIYDQNAPDLSQMFSFACYASRIALERKRDHLVNGVVWALFNALRILLWDDLYFMDFYFIDKECNDQVVYQQVKDIDEDFERTNKKNFEDPISNGNKNDLIYIDPILLFVIELINFSLRLANLDSWIPFIDLGMFDRTEMMYFTENLGRAVNHPCAESEALRAAKEHGYDEDEWLTLQKPKDLQNCTRKVLDFINGKNKLRMFSFVSYFSKLAMRGNRKFLVNEVASALVGFLREYYPLPETYREFDACARSYNVLYHILHSQSDNQEVQNVGSKILNGEEDISYFFWVVTSDEAEESDSQFSTVENDANKRSRTDSGLGEESDSQSSTVERYENEWSEMDLALFEGENEAEESDSLGSTVENNANEESEMDAASGEENEAEESYSQGPPVRKYENESSETDSALGEEEKEAEESFNQDLTVENDANEGSGMDATLAEENEAEGSDAQCSTLGKYAGEGSGMVVSENGNAGNVLKEDIGLGALKTKIGMLGLKTECDYFFSLQHMALHVLLRMLGILCLKGECKYIIRLQLVPMILREIGLFGRRALGTREVENKVRRIRQRHRHEGQRHRCFVI